MSAPSKPRRQGAAPSRPRTPIDRSVAMRHLTWIQGPDGGWFEIRIPKGWIDQHTHAIVPATSLSGALSGYYDDPHNAVVDLTRLEGISAYVVYNPVIDSLKNVSKNHLKRIGSGEGTKDHQVRRYDRVYMDVDSIREGGVQSVSATDSELQFALERQRLIFDEYPELEAAAHYGCSGNGGWAGIDIIPMDDVAEAGKLSDRLLKILASLYCDETRGLDVQRAKIGVECYNPARIGCIAGTYKCKGDPDDERPWRQVTMDSPDRPTKPIHLSSWVDEYPEIQGNGKPRGRIVVPTAIVVPSGNGVHQATQRGGDDEREQRRQEAYVQKACDDEFTELAGTKKDRNIALNKAAFALGQFVPEHLDYGWLENQLFTIAAGVGGIGLTEAETMATIRSGIESGMKDPRDIPPLDPTTIGPQVNLPDCTNVTFEVGGDPQDNGHVHHKEDKKFRPNEAPEDPHRLARLYINNECYHQDGCMLRFYRETWMRWNGHYYEEIPNKEVNAHLSRTAKIEFDSWNKKDTDAWIERGKKNLAGKHCPRPEVRRVGTRTIGDMSQALTSYTILGGKIEAPAWLDERATPDPIEVLPCKNGLIHLPSYVNNDNYFINPTPIFFGTYSLGYDFNSDAPEPTEWIGFLDSIWGDDRDSINTLQEWFGYCLTPDIRQHKMLMMIGPKRAGKDTIGNILQAMIGESNSTGNTLNSFSDRFGITAMIGKPLTVISDARISGRGDLAVIVERLLTISGGGKLTIDRKNMSAWSGVLKTRIVINTNELPRFVDSSGAFASRLLILRLTKSFYGHEDIKLQDRLMGELPGILKWSIAGWKRLNERGKFEQPKSAAGLVKEMLALSSPVSAFVKAKCVVAGHCKVSIQALYSSWVDWCKEVGRREPGDITSFGKNLHSFLPKLKIVRSKKGEGRERSYKGIGLFDPKKIDTRTFSAEGLSGMPAGCSEADSPESNPPF